MEVNCIGRHCADSIEISIGIMAFLAVSGFVLLVHLLVSRKDKNEK